ncbi:hypothetical protein BCR42DRAFT_468179 [Absidia repens]|uniref:Uncharacterized protein n=1 Tax=Absidia repens TaxID=90262 RepID=A0A1X2IBD3_9FUNG|nr:hypothetical protein BCR42DRAFT_468179 [Absidia repens]
MNSLPVSRSSECRLDCLPYDVLVSILQLPILDIHSIMLLAEVWPHYEELSMHVLRYHHLPRLYLQSAMDQEGKRQYLSRFDFHSLDLANRRVTFMVRPGTSKRYISNTFTAASPHLRHITLHCNYAHLLPDPQLHSPNTPTSSADLENICSASSSCSLSSQCPEIIDQNKSLIHDYATIGTNMIQSHSLSLKHGFHTLTTRPSRPYQQKIKHIQRQSTTNTINDVSKDKWQFSYCVSYTNDPKSSAVNLNFDKSRKQKAEHMYLSPISLTVSLSTLRSSSYSIFQPSLIKAPSWFEKYIRSKLSFL